MIRDLHTLAWLLPGLAAGFGLLALALVAAVEGSAWILDRIIARFGSSPSQTVSRKEAA